MNIEKINSDIEMMNDAKGYKLGWRLLNTKIENITKNNGIFLITINPGTGKGNYLNYDFTLSNENGNSLLHENWKSQLQPQLIKMLRLIYGKITKEESFEQFVERILMGYYIPFRSNDVSSLYKDNDIISLCNSIWRQFIVESITKIKILLCIGKGDVYKPIKSLLSEIGYKCNDEKKYHTGWGETTVNITKYTYNNMEIKVAGFPHLGTFKIFSSVYCMENINRIVENLV